MDQTIRKLCNHYKKGMHDCKTKFYLHSMAMGNLNKSEETKPMTTTALKAVLLSTKELKSPLLYHNLLSTSKCEDCAARFTL